MADAARDTPNVFQSWYTLGSIYSNAFKTQSEFKNDCQEEIVKFLFLTHNQNTCVREHLLKEMQDTTSVRDMLQMARMCEGTMHSKELSKQYLESIKTVKQVDSIRTRSTSRGRGCGRGHGHSQNRHRSQSKGKPGPSSNCSNCGSSHPLKQCKAFGKECYYCHKKGHFTQYCRSKQRGRSPSQSRNNARQSCRDVHDIDQSQFDDNFTPQFEQDSITIEFKRTSQLRHSNIMFDEISTAPSLQCVLTDLHVKPIGVSHSYWLKEHFKVDSGACGNLMPLGMYKLLYNREPMSSTINHSVHLLDYNKHEIKQLGTCKVLV